MLVHRPARLQIPQADDVMNLLLLRWRGGEQIERLRDHTRCFEINEELRQLAIQGPAFGGELAVQFFDGQLDEVVGGTALPGEAHFDDRSEEHTSELQSHSFISYAVFCLKKK